MWCVLLLCYWKEEGIHSKFMTNAKFVKDVLKCLKKSDTSDSLSRASEYQLQPGQDDVYNKLSRGHRDEYDVLGAKRVPDPEQGGRHQQRRKNPQDTVYTSLQKDKMGEAYSEIGMKGEQRRRGKGNDGVYQGLSTATKDTYDALQMQPLPRR
ncbi:T-cell surface glycoprotein CD3 zeta chain isoform 2-T4 [Amazona ochrocephala]